MVEFGGVETLPLTELPNRDWRIMDIFEHSSRSVMIGDRILPAVNVQVMGFPTAEYPIYFELPFENGTCWGVSKREGDKHIEVDYYIVDKEDGYDKYFHDGTAYALSWSELLAAYELEVKK